MTKLPRLGLILLLVAILGWFAVLQPQIHTFSSQSTQARALSLELKSYNQRLSDINDIKQQGSAISDSLKAMFLALPKASQVPETLVMIESIASNSGVILSSATVGMPSDGEVPVAIGFSGNLTSVTKFLDAVYANVRTATVKSQSISSDGNGNLTVAMNLGLVYQGGSQ